MHTSMKIQIAIAYGRYEVLSVNQLMPLFYRRHGRGMNVLLNREVLIANLLADDFGYETVERWLANQLAIPPEAAPAIETPRLEIHLLQQVRP